MKPHALMFAGMLSGCESQKPAIASGEVDLREVSAGGQSSPPSADPLAARADSLVRAGRAWRATALLAPTLTNPATASADLRLSGARAAAEWDGWSEVERLLRGAPWLDTQFGGEGRELLVRSALERNTDAVADARLTLASATDEASRVRRHVLLARAHDRSNARDSAAAHYLVAAGRLASVGDWLRLRAAGVTGDSAARSALFGRVRSDVARDRLAATDAQARERAGDLDGSARAFRTAGMEGSAFRIESMAARDDGARAALATRLARFLQGSPSNADARQAIELLDKVGPLSAANELIAARAAAAAGSAARAASGFGKAVAAGALSATDRMSYASALLRAGKAADAARMYGTLSSEPALAPSAAYQRARALLQAGDGSGARAALRRVAEEHGGTPSASAPALLLLADLQVDDGNSADAIRSLRELVTRLPTSEQAPLARFRTGLLEWTSSPSLAFRTFDSIAVLHPRDEEALAARYWSGRALERMDRGSEAKERWRAIIRDSPLSYYAMASARRLDTTAWSKPAGAETSARVVGIDSAVQRVGLLRRLGMDVEARFEIDAIAKRAERTPAEAAAAAQALLAVGEPARAIRLALQAIERGPATRALYLAAFPVVHDDVLAVEAKRHALDPALVAGLIRQESSWNPRAISPATARGLMQLMPAVGASLAASRKFPIWNTALLLEPDVSLELGTAHLSSSFRRGTPPERALAAYNAGGSRLARWINRPGAGDAELFTELIPYTETRDYVRIVLRNAAVYRELYSW